jgi:hypothetical protein
MADIAVTLEAIHIIGFNDVFVDQNVHLTTRPAERVERMATATGNVIARPHRAFELCSQLRSSLFPFFLRRNGFTRLSSDLCVSFLPYFVGRSVRMVVQSYGAEWRQAAAPYKLPYLKYSDSLV